MGVGVGGAGSGTASYGLLNIFIKYDLYDGLRYLQELLLSKKNLL